MKQNNIVQEIWKDIKNFEGIYQVSNLGRVKSVERTITMKHYSGCDAIHLHPERLLSLGSSDKKYLEVNLYNRDKRVTQLVHRLVAETFIPNPNNYPCINHKDENTQNNCADNLEWCTWKYNNNYGKHKYANCKPVIQFDIDGNFIKEFPSISSASREIGCSDHVIRVACDGEFMKKSAYGFRWKRKGD